jgi:hypothetical protein
MAKSTWNRAAWKKEAAAKKAAAGKKHTHDFACAVDPECPENVRSGWSHGWRAAQREHEERPVRALNKDSRALTSALLSVLHALDPLTRDERQRVLLAVTDLLALDRQGNEP